MKKFLQWLGSIFKKPAQPSKPLPVPPVVTPTVPKPSQPSQPSKASPFKKIAIIVGHGSGDPGATAFDGSAEFDYNRTVAKLIQMATIPGKEIRLFFRDTAGITGVNGKVRLWDDDLSLELHCNSYNGKAKGCEILALSGDKESILIGQQLAKKFCDRFGRVLRDGDGVKELKRKDRGHYSLALVDDGHPSILLEPFFIDNKDEWVDPTTYANFLIEWLKEI